MKGWSLLLVLALLAILFIATRERFVATATIKNPNTWDAAELTRIRKLVDGSEFTSDTRTAVAALTDAEIREVVGGFWSYSVPSALPNEPATSKGWSVASTRIPTSDVTEYMNGIIRSTPGYASKRSAFTALITAYYITQGESTFSGVSGYSPGTTESGTVVSTPPSETTPIERPSTSTQSLRQEIATTFGIPTTSSAAIDAVVTKVQSFYDKVYLPDKKTPTYTQITGFVDGVDTSTLPSLIQNNFKVHLIEVLQTYFTPKTGETVTPLSSSATGGADITSSMTSEGGAEGGLTLGTGKSVQGPESGGTGTGLANTTGGLGVPRNYPIVYGGMQEYSSALPTSASLGTDPTSKYLPYSRVPGDQDLYPDPYRLGKYFSSSSYSEKESPEPAPFLADFSKFLT